MIKEIKLYVTGDYNPTIKELDDLSDDLNKLKIKHPFIGGYDTQLLNNF